MLIHFTADRRYAICGSTSVAIDDQMPRVTCPDCLATLLAMKED